MDDPRSSSLSPSISTSLATLPALASVVLEPHVDVVRIEQVGAALLAEAGGRSVGEVVTILGALLVGEAVLFAALEQAVLLSPIAAAVAIYAGGIVTLAATSHAQRTARIGIGARLQSIGVAPDVARAVAEAERGMPLRYWLSSHRTRARLLAARLRTGAE
jgi:hypothetical protein